MTRSQVAWRGMEHHHGDSILVQHVQAAVDRLAELVTASVRASDDDRASILDRMLQNAEALLDQARSDGR